ncbi:MAG: hypothetical protein ACTSPV_07250, partial [Candidatus Hodarchaeales archaeon]
YSQEFQKQINKNQSAFQNLGFFKQKEILLNGKGFWDKLTERFYSSETEDPHNLEFRKFHLKWKRIVNEQYKEEIQNLNMGL